MITKFDSLDNLAACLADFYLLYFKHNHFNMKPQINKELCIGCGACESICPDVFKLDDGKSTVIDLPDYTPYQSKIEQAIEACPVQAISLEK